MGTNDPKCHLCRNLEPISIDRSWPSAHRAPMAPVGGRRALGLGRRVLVPPPSAICSSSLISLGLDFLSVLGFVFFNPSPIPGPLPCPPNHLKKKPGTMSSGSPMFLYATALHFLLGLSSIPSRRCTIIGSSSIIR